MLVRKPRRTSRLRQSNRLAAQFHSHGLSMESLEDRLALATVSWDGEAGDNLWSSALNWVGDVVPTAEDRTEIGAAFASATIVVNSNVVVDSVSSEGKLHIVAGSFDATNASSLRALHVAGGILTGAGDVTVTESFEWTGGVMSGAGTTLVAATATGTMTPPNSNYLYLSRTLENAGELTLNESGYSLLVGDSVGGGAIINLSGATLTLDGAAELQDYGINWGHVSVLANAGGLVHTGAGTSRISVPLANAGAVEVQSGRLELAGGGSFSGSPTLAGDLDLAGGSYTIAADSTFGGSGRFFVKSGNNVISGNLNNLLVSGGQVTIDGQVANFAMTGGSLVGAGDVTVTESFEWTGGVMSGAGTTLVAATATGTITPPSSNYLYLSRTLENAGELTLNESGYSLLVGDSVGGGAVQNRAGATFTLNGAAAVQDYGINWGQVSVLASAGALLHTGEGTGRISVPLANTGVIDVLAGRLELSGGGTFSGTPTVTGDLDLAGGSFTIAADSTFGGSGRFVVKSGSNAIFGKLNHLLVSGGQLSIDGQVANFAMTGGSLEGDGNLTITDNFEWTGGTMGGSGTTYIDESATGTVTPSSNYLYFSGTLENAGELTLNENPSGYSLLVGNSVSRGEIRNLAGATMTLDGAASILDYGINWGQVSVLANAGALLHTGEGTGRISVPLANTGVIDILAGRLELSGGGTFSGTPTVTGDLDLAGGSFTIAADSTLGGSGRFVVKSGSNAIFGKLNHLLVSGGQLSIDGEVANFALTGGSLEGDGNLTITDNFEWTGGTIGGSGTTYIDESATGTVTPSSNYLYFSGTLENAGELTLNENPSGYSLLVGNSVSRGEIRNLAGATMTLDGAASILDYGINWGQVSVLANAGAIVHTGAGAGRISVPLANSGVIDVPSGWLELAGGGSFSGSPTLTGDISVAGGSYTIAADSTLGGTGRLVVRSGDNAISGKLNNLVITGGQLTIDGEAVAFSMTGGSIVGDGDLTVACNFEWTGGSMTGDGRTFVAETATGDLRPPNDNHLYLARQLFNDGQITLHPSINGYSLLMGDSVRGGRIENSPGATFTLDNTAAVLDYGINWGTLSRLNNGGSLRHTGSGTSVVTVPLESPFKVSLDHPPANIDVQGGELSFQTIGAGMAFNRQRWLASTAASVLTWPGSLEGNTTNHEQFSPRGVTRFVGGEETDPRFLEAMGQDRGPSGAGYYQNFAYGVVSLQSAYVHLIDDFDNAAGAGAESIYVDDLIVPAGSTLDLNGIRLYAGKVQNNGVILGDTLTIIPPGISLIPINGTTTSEDGGAVSFQVFLNTKPSADVTIDLASSDESEGAVSNTSVTFTADNWMEPQTVTVTGVDDAVSDGDVAYLLEIASAVSADLNYSGIDVSDVSLTNIDNDTGNAEPIASAGGPYGIAEGDSLALSAAGSFDPDDDPLTYAWDINGDGLFTDASGVAPTLTWAELENLGIADGDSIWQVRVRVSDGFNPEVTSNAATLSVQNVAPTAMISAPVDGFQGVRGQTREFLLSASDPSAADQAGEFTFQIVWEDGAAVQDYQATTGALVQYVYATAGVKNISITATDKDGGQSASFTIQVTIAVSELQGDDLAIGGTATADSLIVSQGLGLGEFSATLNGVSLGAHNVGPAGGVRFFAQQGADTLRINGRATADEVSATSGQVELNELTVEGANVETWQVNTLDGADTIRVAATGVRIDAGKGIDTLHGFDAAATWLISSSNAGSINDQVTFLGVENLVGGSQNDLFRFSGAAGVAGRIDAGDGHDALDYSSATRAVAVNLAKSTATGTKGYSSIEEAIGSSLVNTLTGTSGQNDWSLTGAKSGTINGIFEFAQFENLSGQALPDRFNFGAGASGFGIVNGAGGLDALDFADAGESINIDLGSFTATRLGVFKAIESFVGSEETDTLIGPNAATTWTIDSVDTGKVGKLAFTGFEQLVGAAANDTFQIAAAGQVSGGIDGGAGANALAYSLFGAAGVTVDLTAGSATSIGTLANIAVVVGSAGADTLTGNSDANVLLGGRGADQIFGGGGRDLLIGGTAADILHAEGGEDMLSGGATSYYNETSGKLNLAMLKEILDAWNSAETYEQRIANLTTLPDLATALVRAKTFTNDSNAVDALFGDDDRDWFIGRASDSFADDTADETVTLYA